VLFLVLGTGTTPQANKEVITVVRGFDPFGDVDRLVDQMFAAAAGRATLVMPMDLYRSGEHYVLHADLAGIDPDSLDISVDGSLLTIKAQRSAGTEEGVEWLAQERPAGSFTRRISLSEDVDVDHIAATYQDGVLTLTIPVAESAKPRKISVSTTANNVLDGQLADTKAISESASAS
jgi:HSP20 family protein